MALTLCCYFLIGTLPPLSVVDGFADYLQRSQEKHYILPKRIAAAQSLDCIDKDHWVSTVLVDEVFRANNARSRAYLLRCVISSREGCNWDMYRDRVINISLNNELGVHRDVLRFAEWRLAQLGANTTTSVPTAFAKEICLQGRGVFLWVALVIESFRPESALDEWYRKVRSLPRTVDGLYHLALQEIAPQNAEIVQKLFSWLLAARRPMELSELLEAIAIEVQPQSLPRDGGIATKIRQLQHPETEIPQMCNPLIMITRTSTVTFRHPGVRRFLSTSYKKDVLESSAIEGHQVVAQTCLTLITERESKNCVPLLMPQSGTATSSLIEYASTYWAFHCGLVESHSKMLASALYRTLELTLKRDYQQLSLPESGGPSQIATTVLRIAACHGFNSLTQVSLEMGGNLNGEDCDSCASPLALAVAGGHSEVTALLLQRGASTNAIDPGSDRTALYLAASRGSCKIANMILKAGAKADLPAGTLRWRPLHAAASSGHLDVVKLLMDYEVDVNAVIPTSRKTALHLSACHGHFDVVKWLLEGVRPSKAELDFYNTMIQQGYYQYYLDTMLTNSEFHGRACCRNEDSCFARQELRDLQSLCRRYADVNSRTERGHTPLQLAASNGHENGVRLLLSKGADEAIGNGGQYTALHMAAANGHLNTVRVFLGGGMDGSISSARYGATLKTVTRNGHHAIAN